MPVDHVAPDTCSLSLWVSKHMQFSSYSWLVVGLLSPVTSEFLFITTCGRTPFFLGVGWAGVWRALGAP